MLAKRIIAALDIMDGKVVKGVGFKQIKAVGDPVEMAVKYEEEGADEILFLDISASSEGRKTVTDLASRVSEHLTIPFTVGGGIASVQEARDIIKNGADKIFVNTSAIMNRGLVRDLVTTLGSSNTVVAIDCKKDGEYYQVYSHGGKIPTGLDAITWSQRVEDMGAGELLITSMDRDGSRDGFDGMLVKNISDVVDIPVIASGGAGKIEDFLNVFNKGAQAALGASVFHFGLFTIRELKYYLRESGINVRY